jgi:hypothetical protein
MQGDFLVDEYDTLSKKLLFIIASFFMSVVLLNLVIAIMGDSYGKVMTQIPETDGK